MNRYPVSAIVIAYNEESKIENCLQSLSWVDEILVVDANSTDRTRELCLKPSSAWAGKTRLLTREWSGFKDQRNFSLDHAKFDWVLVIDADEECSLDLREKLLSMLNSQAGPDLKAFKVHRQEFFMGKAIHFGMWNPSYQDRFFYKAGVRYVNDVHEYPVFAHPPGKIHEPLIHKSNLTIEKYLEKLNRYTSIEAKDRFDQGQRTNLFRLIGAFPAHFLKSLFYYKAYRDGFHGVIISLLEGVSRVVRQIKIWQMMRIRSQEKRRHST